MNPNLFTRRSIRPEGNTIVDPDPIENMIFYNYLRDKICVINDKRFQHWYQIFTGILSRVQFPSVMALLDREEIE